MNVYGPLAAFKYFYYIVLWSPQRSTPIKRQLQAVTVVVGSDKNSVLASNASDGQMTLFTPYSSDQMIINLSMKIGEVDSGSTRLLAIAQQSG